jgi:glycosyltransferase involved in cell wall biosynthesis
MPAFNCEPYLGAAIDSVRHQTEPNFELIVVDDGSSDHTLRVAHEIATEDNRIVICHSWKNSGLPAVARNMGLSHASGEFVTFLDADDIYHPEKLRRELEVFQRYSGVDVVFADVVKFKDVPNDMGTQGWIHGSNLRGRAAPFMSRYQDNIYACSDNFYRFMSTELTAINTQTVMIRRTALLAQPTWFAEDLLVGEDADLYFRLGMRGRIAYIDEPLTYYRIRPGSVMLRNPKETCLSRIRLYLKNLQRGRDILPPCDVRAVLRNKVAPLYRDLGSLLSAEAQNAEARRAYLRAFALRPDQRTASLILKTFVPLPVKRWFRAWKHPRPA